MAFAVNGVDNAKQPATNVATDDDKNSRRPSTTDSFPSEDVEYSAALEVLLLVMLGEKARAVCTDRRAQHESTLVSIIIVSSCFSSKPSLISEMEALSRQVQSDGFVPLVTP